jgi:hypothetical protein
MFFFSNVFILGDMNYRVDLDKKEALSLIEQNNFQKLKEFDQLAAEKKYLRIFSGFKEGTLPYPT